MKTKYIKPSTEVTEFVSDIIMSAGSATNGINVVQDGRFDSSTDEQYGNDRRGWGDLWK